MRGSLRGKSVRGSLWGKSVWWGLSGSGRGDANRGNSVAAR